MLFRQTRALLGKELQQHRRILIALSMLLGVFWLIGWASFVQGTRGVSRLQVLPAFLMLGLPAAALVLGHRLVVTEYYGRTQRFLEALPVHRAQEAVVKAGFGLACLLGWALAALAATAALALAHESLERRFLVILTARTSAFIFACWGVTFLFSMFGRLRLPLLIAAVAAVALIVRTSELSLGSWGPFALIHPGTFPVERNLLPRAALAWSTAVGAMAFALAIALVRVREGLIVESLARPLFLREKAAILVVVMAAAMALMAVEKRKRPPMPAVEAEQVLHAGNLEIVHMDAGLRPAAERIAATLSPLLQGLAPLLPPPALRVRLVHGSDVLPERPQLASVHRNEGLVVRVHLPTFVAPAAPAGQAARAAAELVHHVIRGGRSPGLHRVQALAARRLRALPGDPRVARRSTRWHCPCRCRRGGCGPGAGAGGGAGGVGGARLGAAQPGRAGRFQPADRTVE